MPTFSFDKEGTPISKKKERDALPIIIIVSALIFAGGFAWFIYLNSKNAEVTFQDSTVQKVQEQPEIKSYDGIKYYADNSTADTEARIKDGNVIIITGEMPLDMIERDKSRQLIREYCVKFTAEEFYTNSAHHRKEIQKITNGPVYKIKFSALIEEGIRRLWAAKMDLKIMENKAQTIKLEAEAEMKAAEMAHEIRMKKLELERKEALYVAETQKMANKIKGE